MNILIDDRPTGSFINNSKVRASNERFNNANTKVPTVYKVGGSTEQLPKISSNNKTKTTKGGAYDQMAGLPAIVKNSIIQQQENSVTVNLNTFINYQDFFPLDVFMASFYLILYYPNIIKYTKIS